MSIFNGVFSEDNVECIKPGMFVLCIGISLLIGIFLAGIYTIKSKYTTSFLVTLALLPAVVCVVIMMVNGNVGAGVAVAGAFSLVRFRSAPGTAREIATLFLAMGAGLIAGMGYLAYAVLFAVIMGIALLIFDIVLNGEKKNTKLLKITIPEDLDYVGMFDDLLDEYMDSYEEVSVKTSNMGSLFKLTYKVTLKGDANEKKFIDELRCRNGNLEISISKPQTAEMTL